jgi:hypothetical protein
LEELEAISAEKSLREKMPPVLEEERRSLRKTKLNRGKGVRKDPGY